MNRDQQPESPCDFHCGYYDSGQSLWNHVFWEHRQCTECGRKPFDGYAVSHEPDCPRLKPGYTYPPASALDDPAGAS